MLCFYRRIICRDDLFKETNISKVRWQIRRGAFMEVEVVNMKPVDQYFSIAGLLKSFKYALQGIWFCLKTQRNAFIHLLVALIVCLAGFYFQIHGDDWRWILLCIMLVWFAETINTAFEYVCDLIHPEFSQSVKGAKDIAAGAVLICSIGAALIGVITFLPYWL